MWDDDIRECDDDIRECDDDIRKSMTTIAASPAAGQDADAKIANAMSAAPSAISDDATILDNALDDAGKFVVLREGSNGWYCFPDVPSTPGNDPRCLDQTWLDWTYAFLAGEEPTMTVLGLRLHAAGRQRRQQHRPLRHRAGGGRGVDHFTAARHAPPAGEIDQTAFTTDHHSGGPYIMWAGTPYEHIMMPVAEGEHEM